MSVFASKPCSILKQQRGKSGGGWTGQRECGLNAVKGSERTDDGPVSTMDLFGGWFGGFRHSASPSSIAVV